MPDVIKKFFGVTHHYLILHTIYITPRLYFKTLNVHTIVHRTVNSFDNLLIYDLVWTSWVPFHEFKPKLDLQNPKASKMGFAYSI